MQLESITVVRYRQLRNLTFDPSNWTVIVGPNGSGKSTLARAVEFAFQGVLASEIHHANSIPGLRTILGRKDPLEVSFTVNLDDLTYERLVQACKSNQRPVEPYKPGTYSLVRKAHIKSETGDTIAQISFGINEAKDKGGNTFRIDTNQDIFTNLISSQQLLLIPAERRLGNVRDDGQPGHPSDGERLLHVLFEADTNHDTVREEHYERFNRCMLDIFPEFKRIKPVSRNGSSDLNFGAFPAAWVGSGHREAAAIVGEIATCDSPIVIIEEPERSFHPGLIRHFLDCLRNEFSERQFIILTHSPVVMAGTRTSDIWEFRKDFNIRKIEGGNAAAVAASLGVRISDVLDYELLLLVEGVTDAAAWDAWFEQEGLGRFCKAIDINGFGNAQYFANASVIKARVNRPIVCVAFDGDILAKRGGQDNVDKAKPLCEEHGGQLFKCDKDTLEEYLLNPDALAAAYQKASQNIQTWIADSTAAETEKLKRTIEKNPSREKASVAKQVLADVLWKIGQHTYDETHASNIAKALDKRHYPKDSKGTSIIAELKRLLEQRKK